LVVKTKTIGNY